MAVFVRRQFLSPLSILRTSSDVNSFLSAPWRAWCRSDSQSVLSAAGEPLSPEATQRLEAVDECQDMAKNGDPLHVKV